MKSESQSKELVISNNKEKFTVKFEQNSILNIVDKEIFLENRQEVKKYLPEILGRVLARIWIDQDFKLAFKNDPLKTLSDNGVFLPEEMYLEFQKADTKDQKLLFMKKR